MKAESSPAPTTARDEFIAEATKHAILHLKSLEAVGKRAAESLKNIRYPSLAVNAAMENLRNSGMSRIIDDLKKQQQSLVGMFDSPAMKLAQEMVKEQKERAEQLGSFRREEQHVLNFLASPPHQHRLHPQDADRFDRIENRLAELKMPQKEKPAAEIIPAEESDFTFDDKGLCLSHKGRRLLPLTSLEMILCRNIFTETIGYRFRTLELEKIVYPGDYAEGDLIKDRLKKLVLRFNVKIANQTGVKKFLLYSEDFVSRQF